MEQKKIHDNVMSYDPGSVNLLAAYNPAGNAYLLGKGCDKKLLELLYELDDLYSLRSWSRDKSYLSIKRKIIKLRKKIYYLKKEITDQCNNWVTKQSELIIYPKLKSGELTLKAQDPGLVNY